MRRAIPVLRRSTEASAKGLREEDVFKGVAGGNVRVDKVVRERRDRRAEIRLLEELESDSHAVKEEPIAKESG